MIHRLNQGTSFGRLEVLNILHVTCHEKSLSRSIHAHVNWE